MTLPKPSTCHALIGSTPPQSHPIKSASILASLFSCTSIYLYLYIFFLKLSFAGQRLRDTWRAPPVKKKNPHPVPSSFFCDRPGQKNQRETYNNTPLTYIPLRIVSCLLKCRSQGKPLSHMYFSYIYKRGYEKKTVYPCQWSVDQFSSVLVDPRVYRNRAYMIYILTTRQFGKLIGHHLVAWLLSMWGSHCSLLLLEFYNLKSICLPN